MKNKLPLTLAIFILTAALAACSAMPGPRPAMTPVPLETQPATQEQVASPEPLTEVPQDNSLPQTGSTGAPAATSAPQTTAAPQVTTASTGGPLATVNTDSLNLRMGPGTNYQVIKMMPKGLELTILGRNAKGDWLEATLPDGSGGWVFAGYVDLAVPITRLPVTEASGGPFATAPVEQAPIPATTNPAFNLVVSIANDEASLQVSRFPANQSFVVSLAREDGSGSLVVAGGETDANGAANVTFRMPAQWSDGEAIVENSLILVVTTSTGSFSRSATIQYFPPQ